MKVVLSHCGLFSDGDLTIAVQDIPDPQACGDSREHFYNQILPGFCFRDRALWLRLVTVKLDYGDDNPILAIYKLRVTAGKYKAR